MEMMKGMSSEDLMGMMHEEMPKIMKSCFGKMSEEERVSMLSMCRGMLDDLEKEMKGFGSSGSA